MSYEKIGFENKPSNKTPISAENLNHMEKGIFEAHESTDFLERNLIVQKVDGEVATTTDSAKVKPKNIKLFGKGKQRQYEGNQLLSYPYISTSEAYHGITTTDNGDGSITFKGTNNNTTDDYYYNLLLFDGSRLNLKAGTYTLSAQGIVDGMVFQFFLEGQKKYVEIGETFTITEDEEVSVYVVILKGRAVDTTIFPMLNKGTTALPWEPFTNNEPSPSMNYPQKAEFLGESGSIGGKVLCGNVWNPALLQSYSYGGIKADFVNGKVRFFGDAIVDGNFRFIEPNTMNYGNSGKITISAQNIDGTMGEIIVNNYKDDVWNYMATMNASNNYTVTVELGDYDIIPFLCFLNGVTYDTYFDFIINYGGKTFPYEPYTEQPFTFLTPNGLRGIPLGQTIPDAIKNSPIHMSGVYWDGEQYQIADTENENGKDVQRIWKYTLAEDDKQYIGMATSSAGNQFQIKPTILNKLPTIINCNDGSIVMSNVAIGIPHDQRGNKEFVSIYCANSMDMYIRDRVKNELTIEDVRNADITIWYVLAEPIITERTSEETESFNALVMNYPNTTIVNDDGAYMEVEYVADTKKHIEQNYVAKTEFKELQDTVLEIQRAIVNE